MEIASKWPNETTVGGFTLGARILVHVTLHPIHLISVYTSIPNSGSVCESHQNSLEKAVWDTIHVYSGTACRRCESSRAKNEKWDAL